MRSGRSLQGTTAVASVAQAGRLVATRMKLLHKASAVVRMKVFMAGLSGRGDKVSRLAAVEGENPQLIPSGREFEASAQQGRHPAVDQRAADDQPAEQDQRQQQRLGPGLADGADVRGQAERGHGHRQQRGVDLGRHRHS